MVDCYMEIVSKTTKDMVPKTIMYFMIKNTEKFIKADLLPKLIAINYAVQLLSSCETHVKLILFGVFRIT